jgi:hypothetical protein
MDEPLVEEPRPAEEAPPAKKSKRRDWLWAGLVVAAALVGYAIWSGVSGPDAKAPPDTATTCDEWNAKGPTNKTIQARVMLISLRHVDGLGAPTQAQVEQFAAGLTNVCGAASGTSALSELAATLYLTEKSRFA